MLQQCASSPPANPDLRPWVSGPRPFTTCVGAHSVSVRLASPRPGGGFATKSFAHREITPWRQRHRKCAKMLLHASAKSRFVEMWKFQCSSGVSFKWNVEINHWFSQYGRSIWIDRAQFFLNSLWFTIKYRRLINMDLTSFRSHWDDLPWRVVTLAHTRCHKVHHCQQPPCLLRAGGRT